MKDVERTKPILVHNKDNTYTYGKLMKDFVEYIKSNDLGRLRDVMEPIRFEHVSTRIAYKKRFMKTRLTQSYVNKPVLSVNGAIYTDEDGNDMFPGDFFNTDMTTMMNINPEGYSDVCIRGGESETIKDSIKLLAVPRRAKMNIEMTFIHDFYIQLENLRQMWNIIRYRDHKGEAMFHVRNIIPANVVLNLCYALGLFKTPDELKNIPYKDIYLFLRKYTMPGFILTYEYHGGTGKYEICLGYMASALIKPELMVVEKGDTVGNIERNSYLMRPFIVEFNIVNMFYLVIKKYYDFNDAIRDLITFDNEESKYLGENINKLYETATGDRLAPPVYAPKFVDNLQMITEATYTRTDNTDCTIYELLDEEVYNFLKLLMRNNINIEPYFKCRVYIDSTMEEEIDIDVDYNKLVIPSEELFINKRYTIRLFLDCQEHQRYITKVEGYEKLK